MRPLLVLVAGFSGLGVLALLGAAALPRRGGATESSPPPDAAVNVIAGLGVFALLSVAAFASKRSLVAFLGALGASCLLAAIRVLRARGAAPAAPASPTRSWAPVAIEILAAGSAIGAVLVAGVRYVGGDELYHLARIRVLLLEPLLTLGDPTSGVPRVPSQTYLVPVFHLLAATMGAPFRLPPEDAYRAVCVFMVLVVALVIRHLARRVEGALPSAVFGGALALQLLWLPAVDTVRNQYNNLFPFKPSALAGLLIALVLTLALSAIADHDTSEARWRPVCLGLFGAMLVHASPLLIVFPWLAISVALLVLLGRLRPGELGAIALRLAPVVLAAVLLVIAVKTLGGGTILPNDLDPVLTRKAPLHPFETARLERVVFLSDDLYFVRLTGQMLVGAAVTIGLVLLHVTRGGNPALLWIAAGPIFALLLLHDPFVFPFVARRLTFHFGLLWGLEHEWVPGYALPLALASAARIGPGPDAASRPSRRALGAAFLSFLAVLGLFTVWRMSSLRGMNAGLQALSRPALWKAVEKAGDPERFLLTHPDTALAVYSFSSMKPYFCNRPPCRPYYADYFARRSRAKELLGGAIDASSAAREGIWGELRRLDEETTKRPAVGQVVYRDQDWELLRFGDGPAPAAPVPGHPVPSAE